MAGSAEFFKKNLPTPEAAFRLKTEMQNEKASLSALPWLVHKLISSSRQSIQTKNNLLVHPDEGLTPEVQKRVWNAAQDDFVSITFSGILLEMFHTVEDGEFKMGTVIDVFNDNTRGTVLDPYKIEGQKLKSEKLPEEKLSQLKRIIAKDPTFSSVFFNMDVWPDALKHFVTEQGDLLSMLRNQASDWRPLAAEFLKLTGGMGDIQEIFPPQRTKKPEQKLLSAPQLEEYKFLSGTKQDQEKQLLERGFTQEQIDALNKISMRRKPE